jgi:hypothetical protein
MATPSPSMAIIPGENSGHYIIIMMGTLSPILIISLLKVRVKVY